MLLIKSLNGDLFTIDWDQENPPTVPFIREHLRKTIDFPRNEYIRLFLGDSELTDADDVKDENELMMMVDHEKKLKSHEKDIVELNLIKYLGENAFNIVKTLVKETCSLVAGGSIVCGIHNQAINDLDIYVHYSKSKEFMEKLKSSGFFFDTFKWNLQGPYDQSFFYKNKILARFNMLLRQRIRTKRRLPNIDILIIPDNHPIENVVTNFDLSFCETWWDGDHLYASDPYGVRNKEGVLKPDYQQSLFSELNSFIIKRIHKYNKRGFKIDVGRNGNDKDIVLMPKLNRKVNTGERWAIYFFLKQISSLSLIPVRYQTIHTIYYTFYPQEMTYNALVEKWGNEDLVQKFSCYLYYELASHLNETYISSYKSTFPNCDKINRVNLDEIKKDIEELLISK